MSGKHLAAILPQKGGPFTITERTTPEPGPNEYLIEVKAVAMNPADYYQRDFGFPPVPIHSAVIGADASGTVVKAGSDIEASLAVGSRVAAFASPFYNDGKPDYGSFQQYVLASAEGVVALPDSISFEEGATVPLATLTALTAYTTVGISLDTKYSAADKEAILIWGASSSVGTFAVQSAKSMGFIVYATASPQHHDYIKKLGAHKVFNYKDDDAVSQIINAVKDDGPNLSTAHCVTEGALQPTLDVLKATKGSSPGKVAHSAILSEGHPTVEDTTILFNFPTGDKKARDQHISKVFRGWLEPGLK